MSFTFKERKISTDAEGFLSDRNEWSEELMRYMAQKDGLQLTQAHLLVIRTVREFYEEYATTPAMRMLIAILKKKGHPELASSMELAKLFPQGAAKSAARYAGLPKPVKCI